MEKLNEIKGLLFNGFIGLLLGWGGFTQLFPNLLEILGDVAELGSYSALRIFSIIFFLSIIFLITSYWWIWGIEQYEGSRSESSYKSSAFILCLGLKLLPILGFIADPFFVHSSYSWFNFFEFTIWFYLLIAITELLLVSWLFYPESGAKLLKVNTVIFSLDVVLGIGVVSFIEPWANYKTDFIYEAVGVGVIYAFVSLFAFYRIREDKVENDYKDLAVGLLVIPFLLGGFPAVNYNYWVAFGGILIVLVGVLALGVRLFQVYKRNHPLWINLILVGTVLVILLAFHGALMLHSNKNYFLERKEASTMISKNKINPLVAYKYLRTSDRKTEAIDGTDVHNINELIKDNHKWAYVSKGLSKGNYTDSLLSQEGTIDIQSWIKLKADHNVRTFFFKNYNSNLKLEDQKSLNKFYNANYQYIHNEIIDNTLISINALKGKIPEEQFSKFENYYHPINYYTKTLNFYKQRLEKIDSVLVLSEFILRMDSLYKQSDNSNLSTWNYKILRKEKTDKVKTQLSEIYEFENIDLGDEVDIGKSLKVFELFSRHKNLEYRERYEKAQIIFHVYLKDAQRVGVYILLYALIIAILFLWFWYHDKKDTDMNSDTSFGFVIVWFLSVLVTLAYIARPIEAGNINPEKPHWMMNLDNWYSHTDFAISSWGEEKKKDPAPTTIVVKNDHKKLVRSLESINETLDRIDAALAPIKELNLEQLDRTHQNIESMRGDLDTLNIRFENHGDFPDEKQKAKK